MTADLNSDHSKWKKPRPLLSEMLRPEALSDLTLPTPTIERIQRVIETGSIVNMLFHGPLGSGKTSAAKILIKAMGGGLTIKRSSKASLNVAKSIKESAASVCFVDDADLISKPDQMALADTIDQRRSCRFLFTATDIKKLIPTLRSRLMEICFEVLPEDRDEVKQRLMKRYENMLPANGFTFERVRLEQIIDVNFPDLRSIANNIEFEFG